MNDFEEYLRENYIIPTLYNDFGAECTKDCLNRQSILYLSDIKWMEENNKTKVYIECSSCKEYAWGSEWETDLEINSLEDVALALFEFKKLQKEKELQETYDNPSIGDIESYLEYNDIFISMFDENKPARLGAYGTIIDYDKLNKALESTENKFSIDGWKMAIKNWQDSSYLSPSYGLLYKEVSRWLNRKLV